MNRLRRDSSLGSLPFGGKIRHLTMAHPKALEGSTYTVDIVFCIDARAGFEFWCRLFGSATEHRFLDEELRMVQGIKYAVDIVFCIDSTGSMSSIIELVKTGALKFHDDLSAVMNEKSKAISSLRVRVISFRDYWADGPGAMDESPFFRLPDQKDEFARFVTGITAQGGGDEPENGLEALALAIRSDWTKEGDRKRQLVVMWTDASAHALDKSSKPSGYPENLPKNLDEITDLWEGHSFVSANGKRLILYAPDAEPWSGIANSWENAIHYPSRAGEGLKEVTRREILDAIANSV